MRHRWWVHLAWLGLCAQPPTALGFGAEGHRITGFVAQALLTEQARSELTALLGAYDLAELALVADEQRSQLKAELPDSPRWHYDDRLVCHADLPLADYCPAGACASAAIAHFRAVLADRTAARDERARAVMFLVHLIGDLHQPLHAADNNDRGGNATRVTLPGEARVHSLHLVWDVDLVRLAVDGQPLRQVAQAWRLRYSGDLPRWQSGSVEDWMRESYQVAVTVAYEPLPGFACDQPAREVVALPSAYVNRAGRLIPSLLTQAGARIAQVLNDALSSSTRGP